MKPRALFEFLGGFALGPLVLLVILGFMLRGVP